MLSHFEIVISQPAATLGDAKSDCELREIALDGIFRLQDDQRRKRRQPWLRVFYIVFSCTLYVGGFFVVMATPIRPSHNLATLGRNKTSNQHSELASGKQSLMTMSR